VRLTQAKLSRKSNQVARGRIRRFESYMPSQAVHRAKCESARNRAADQEMSGFRMGARALITGIGFLVGCMPATICPPPIPYRASSRMGAMLGSVLVRQPDSAGLFLGIDQPLLQLCRANSVEVSQCHAREYA
jgi:hypothetical protein